MEEFKDNSVIAIGEFIDVSTKLLTERNLTTLLETIVASARKITRAETGMIYLLDKAKTYLYVDVFQGNHCEESKYKLPNVELYIDSERNMTNLVSFSAFTGETRHVDDVYKYSGFDFNDIIRHDKITSFKTKSITAVPLRNHENVTIGILVLVNFLDEKTNKIVKMNPALEGVVKAFAVQAAVAINNVQLIKQNAHLIDVLNHTNKILEKENSELRSAIKTKYTFDRIIGQSPAMQKVYSLMEKVIESDATVLIRGETGTGKELVAQALHYNSKRKQNRFVVQNCAAFPEHLLESELFGYKKGAFSGANTDKKGLIEIADGGTLFLDEIGDMPIGLQAKILRVLQDKVVRPLGSTESRGTHVDVRIIAATHCDLQEKIISKEFREDLYYRLCMFPIDLPPIKKRKSDMPVLLNYFLNKFSDRYGKNIAGYSPKAMDALIQYPYPGNIRDMSNVVERAVLLAESGGYVDIHHLSDDFLTPTEGETIGFGMDSHNGDSPLRNMLADYEARLIKNKLIDCQWNQTKAADELKIARRTIIEKMNRYGIIKNEREQNIR